MVSYICSIVSFEKASTWKIIKLLDHALFVVTLKCIFHWESTWSSNTWESLKYIYIILIY